MAGENMPSAYRIPAYEFTGRCAATNKPTYVAYRGPWEVETWVRERLLDEAAQELGNSARRASPEEPGHLRGAAARGRERDPA